MKPSKSASKSKLRLRTVLLFVNLMVLLLPLGGLFFFRFYENALVQQTEAELIAQSAVIAAIYKQQVIESNQIKSDFGIAADPASLIYKDDFYTPVPPKIDLSKAVLLPPRPDGQISQNVDSFTHSIGKKLLPILEDAKRTTLSGVRILDYNGIVIAGKEEIERDFSKIHEVSRALKGFYTSVIRERISDDPPPALASISRGTGIRVFTAFPIIHEGRVWGVVYMSRTPKNILKYLYSEKERVALTGFVLVMLAALIALLTSYMIVLPINKLLSRVKAFSAGDKQAMEKLNVSGVREVEMLAQSFSEMALSLHNRSEYIKNFATHVSHEFKTPMTSIQGAAELLLDHMDEMEYEKKNKFLSNIIADSERLKRLVNRLLELAKADNVEMSNETCDAIEILEQLKGRYHDLGLNLTYSLNAPLRIKIAADHLETIFVNLLDNALQHGADEVQVLTEEDTDKISVIMSDNGMGISQGNKDKIFDTFFTTKREDGGTGLGLGIVQSLIKTHNGSIDVLDCTDGAQFKIQFQKH